MSRLEDALNRAAAGDRRPVDAPAVNRSATGTATLGDYPNELVTPDTVQAEVAVSAPAARLAAASLTSAPIALRSISATDPRMVNSPEATPLLIEQYRRLAASLHDAQAERNVGTVMISSALPREGKSLTSVNLALTLAEAYEQRVLLVDADLRAPSLHRFFGLDARQGLAEYLTGSVNHLPTVAVSPRLSLMVAGRHANPTAGLISERMPALVQSARQAFDWVIIDTPPVGLLPDANLVARVADAVLFVAAAASSPYGIVQRAIAQIGPERVLGVVLNRAAERVVPNSAHYRHYRSS